MGNPPWASDPRFATCSSRWKWQEELDSLISRWTRDRDSNDLMAELQLSGIAAGPVNKDADLLADPHLADRGFFEPLNHSETGHYLYPGPMWRSRSFPNQLRTPPCNLGQHNEYAYRDLLGYTDNRYDELEAAGHIGTEFHPNVT